MGVRGRRRGTTLSLVVVLLVLLAGAGAASGPRRQQVSALFFGDSLIAGVGAEPQRPVQVRTATSLLGWHGVVDARGGTGFTTGGRSGKPYLQRFRQDGYLRRPYAVIVLQGGTNDAHHGSLTRLHTEALRTVDYVLGRQPRARLVLVGPFAPPGVQADRYVAADRVLAQVAAERGLQYVSQVGYRTVTARGFLSKDGYHPSNAGYTRMGRDLAASIRLGASAPAPPRDAPASPGTSPHPRD